MMMLLNLSLCFMYTLQNYGPWFDIAGAGIYSVILADLKKTSKDDLSSGQWTYQVLILYFNQIILLSDILHKSKQ